MGGEWLALLGKYQLVPAEYGHWVDSRLHEGRGLNSKESCDMLVRDIKLAHRLGFKVGRTKLGVIDEILTPVKNWKEFIEMALPVAEEFDFKMCPEIHMPTVLKSKMVDDYIDFIEKTGTRYFGINIDFGVFAKRSARMQNIPGVSKEPSIPEDMIPLLPYTYACHAKFNNVSDDLIETSIPYDQIIAILLEHKWEGYLLSEYEGRDKAVPGHASDQLRRQHVMMKRYLGEVRVRAKRMTGDQMLGDARMLESPNIQSRGFRNISEEGQVTGFQVPVRLTHYRGVWLTQLRPATVTVDGEKCENETITWVIDGKSYSQEELKKNPDVQWSSLTPAVLRVRKPGGLRLGIHDVEVKLVYSTSYLPPRLDLGFPGREPCKRRMTLVR